MNYDEVLGLDDWTAFLGTDELHTQAQDSLWAAVGLQDPLLFDAPSQQPATNQPVQTKSRGRVYTVSLDRNQQNDDGLLMNHRDV